MSRNSILCLAVACLALVSCGDGDFTKPRVYCTSTVKTGYTDRWGRALTQCAHEELSCVKPLKLANRGDQIVCVLSAEDAYK